MYPFIKKKREEYQITLDDIRHIEKEFNIKFPDDLVEFLLEFNGAEIHLCGMSRKDVLYEVDVLFPVKFGRLPVEKIMEWNKRDGILKDGLIPIADNQGGDPYYLDSSTGKVWLYFADDYDNPRLMRGSFQEFLNQLEIREE